MGKKYTVGFVFNHDCTKVLMIKKNGGPYPGMYNGVGGHLEPTDPSPQQGFAREVGEEAGIQIWTPRLLTTMEFPNGVQLHVLYTKLAYESEESDVPEQCNEGSLHWFEIKDGAIDLPINETAGEGNIPYFIYYSLYEMGCITDYPKRVFIE
jgi:ADP-ribose pyrophosphatase YjhB (NUDIX family)